MRRAIVFTTYKDRKGEHRWRAMHGNGKIIADSSEGYKTRGSAVRAAKALVAGLIIGGFVLVEGK